jgi:ACS family pantothenate transporter-like MFS transporter
MSKTSAHVEVVLIEHETKAKPTIWRRIFPKVEYKSPREKAFVRKLDIFLLTWTTIAYFMKSIDQTNISNAYVSGMKEELGFHGKQYNWLDTYFKIGYSISLIPSQILMNKVKPTYLLSTFEIIWGIFVALCAIPKTPQGLYPLRFFIGFFEASSWPGIIITLMNYYTREELATRIGIFQASYYAGNMFSGFLQSAIYKTLNGVHGLFGFQWLFIINGLMTIAVGFFGYFFIPDTPENGGSKVWMNDTDREIAIERMQRVGRETKRRLRFKEVYELLLDWRLWLFLAAYCTKAWCSAFSYFNLWLKSMKNANGTSVWSVEQINLIPIGGNAISLVCVILWAKLADLTQKPEYILAFQLIVDLFSNIVLAIWPTNLGIKYAAFFLMPIADAVTSLLISLLAEVYSTSPEKRAIATGAAVVLVYANNAWLALYLWPANEAPRFKWGYKMSILFLCVSLISSLTYCFFVYKKAVRTNNALREEREAAKDGDLNLEEIVESSESVKSTISIAKNLAVKS